MKCVLTVDINNSYLGITQRENDINVCGGVWIHIEDLADGQVSKMGQNPFSFGSGAGGMIVIIKEEE